MHVTPDIVKHLAFDVFTPPAIQRVCRCLPMSLALHDTLTVVMASAWQDTKTSEMVYRRTGTRARETEQKRAERGDHHGWRLPTPKTSSPAAPLPPVGTFVGAGPDGCRGVVLGAVAVSVIHQNTRLSSSVLRGFNLTCDLY